MNFDLSKYLNKDRLYDILNKNEGKKIICFGAGAATYVFPRILPKGYQVAYYVDSNPNIWGTFVDGKEIKSPLTLMEEEKNSFIIFIVSQHYISIQTQLEGYGFKAEEEFYEIYSSVERCFLVQKVMHQAEKMIYYINNLPKESMDGINRESNNKIGVVTLCEYTGLPTFYDIGIYLLLKYSGYNVDLIIDNTYSCENVTIYEGASLDIKEIVDEVLQELKKQFPCTKIHYIDENKQAILVEEDRNRIEIQTQLSVVWQKSRKNNRLSLIYNNGLDEKLMPILTNNLSNIKYFFENCSTRFDILTVSTALHFRRGFYMWMGEKLGMRVANYDGASSNGRTRWATNYPNGHQYDIPKVINGDYFTELEKSKVIEYSKKLFERNINTISDGKSYFYQIVNATKEESTDKDLKYDVIIPLNVMWDAAAIGQNDIFHTETEWIIETIEYILGNSTSNIMIREHPFLMRLKRYNNESYEEMIKEKFQDNSRIRYVKYDEEVNTYQYIRNSKVVLPLSSTVGIEAALLGKDVIVHASCYYASLNFVKKATTKEEYWSLIKEYLSTSTINSNKNLDEAWMAYCLIMHTTTDTIFNENTPEWMDLDIKELLNREDVQSIINAIVNDKPICYVNTKNVISKD